MSDQQTKGVNATPLPMDTIRQYAGSLTWVENGLLTQDMTHVIDFLQEEQDSRWFVAQTRRCLAMIRHWQERLRYAIRKLEIQVADSRDNLDKPAREQIRQAGRQIRMRYVDAEINRNPQYRQLVDSIHQYEQALGTLEGLELALDTSLIVQEAISSRRHEYEQNLVP